MPNASPLDCMDCCRLTSKPWSSNWFALPPGLPEQARRSGAIHLSARPAGWQRGALLPSASGSHRGDDARGVHPRGWAGMRTVQSDLSPTARPVHPVSATRFYSGAAAHRALNREVDVVVVRRWGSFRILGLGGQGDGRPRHPHRQACLVYPDRGDSAGSDLAHCLGRGHEQCGSPERSGVPGLAPRARQRAGLR